MLFKKLVLKSRTRLSKILESIGIQSGLDTLEDSKTSYDLLNRLRFYRGTIKFQFLEWKEVKNSLSQQEYSTLKKFQQTIIWKERPQGPYIEEDYAIFLLEHNVSFKFLGGNRPLCLLT